jgi:hypothetical protein
MIAEGISQESAKTACHVHGMDPNAKAEVRQCGRLFLNLVAGSRPRLITLIWIRMSSGDCLAYSTKQSSDRH